MSPFVRVVEKLAARVAESPPSAQVALLACAGGALAPRYVDWCAESGVPDESELLRSALELGRAIALGGTAEPAGEVKNVSRLGYSSQIRDFYEYSVKANLTFQIHVRVGTRLQGRLASLVDEGKIVRIDVPGMGN